MTALSSGSRLLFFDFQDLVRLSISLAMISISRPFTLPLLVEMSWVKVFHFSNDALDDRSLKAAFPSLRAFTFHGDAPPVFNANSLDLVFGALRTKST